MQARFRWYRIQLPRKSPELATLLSFHNYDADQGFVLANGIFNHPVHRFIWKSEIIVSQLDENGEQIFQRIPTINFTDFVIINIDDSIFLRIENPGRSVKDLFNTLESIIGLGFTCKPVIFDKKTPTTVFKHIDVNKLISLKVTDAVLDKDLIANMEFSSKEGIDPEEINILRDIYHKIESATYECIYRGQRGFLSLSSSGMVKVRGLIAQRLIHLIEQDLVSIFSRSSLN